MIHWNEKLYSADYILEVLEMIKTLVSTKERAIISICTVHIGPLHHVF